MNYSSLLYQIAGIDDQQYDNMTATELIAKQQIQKGQYQDATETFKFITDTLITGFTGLQSHYNLLLTNNPDDGKWMDYLNLQSTRQQIGVGNITFSDGAQVEINLKADITKSIKHKLSIFLDSKISVLLYNGQLDVIVAPVLTEAFLKR